jgi:RNA polymerase sigma-70 factor (ECF subfamily)
MRDTNDAYPRLSRRILATVIRLVGDMHVAEEAVQDAFAVALQQWPAEGSPTNPRAWIISTARHKAIDVLRRAGRFAVISGDVGRMMEMQLSSDDPDPNDAAIPDERLRLIFTCCHPALTPDAQIALTLREVCGLTTEEIARAFLSTAPAMRSPAREAQDSGCAIPYEVPPPSVLPERLEAAMAVVYLLFNEGYGATAGEALVRTDLCQEAIRLGRVLAHLMPDDAEARGLLALMLLHDARRSARTSAEGDLVLLEDQDRGLWNHEQIAEGLALIAPLLGSGVRGPYTLQAAIAAEHARARRPQDTDWHAIARVYGQLLELRPSPVVELNRAVAVAMADGPEAGLALVVAIKSRGELSEYYLLWSAEADLLRRCGRLSEAATAYRKALDYVTSEPERRFLTRRLSELGS